MNSRERIIATLRKEKTDRIPVCSYGYAGWFDAAGEEMQQKLINNTDIIIITVNDSDIKQVLGETYKNVYDINYKNNIVIETVTTPKGLLKRIKKIDGCSELIIEEFFKNKEDIEKFLSIPFIPFKNLETKEYTHYEEIIKKEGIVLNRISNAASLPYDWFKPEKYYFSLIDHEKLIYKLTEELAYRIESYVDKLIKNEVNKFVIAGCERFGGGLTNPRYFDDLVYKYDKKLVNLIHKNRGIAQVHMHGKIKNYLGKIIDMGFDCIEPVEHPPGGDLSLKEARKIIGNKMSILGNLDDLQFLNTATEKQITKQSLQAILDAGINGNYMLGGTSSSIFTENIANAFFLMAKVSKEYGTYPIDLDKILSYINSLE